jgi:hypothetical protein
MWISGMMQCVQYIVHRLPVLVCLYCGYDVPPGSEVSVLPFPSVGPYHGHDGDPVLYRVKFMMLTYQTLPDSCSPELSFIKLCGFHSGLDDEKL